MGTAAKQQGPDKTASGESDTRGELREEERCLRELESLLARTERGSVSSLSSAELTRLPNLYRQATSIVARFETLGHDRATSRRAKDLAARAHGLLFREERRDPRTLLRTLGAFLAEEVPRAVRAEWRLLLMGFVALYGLAAVAFIAVRNELDLAPSLLNPQVVAAEIGQLQATESGEPFRGNFTFGIGESPSTAGRIMAHNMGVSVLFFAGGLIPPFFAWILLTNALMLGTYLGVASQWGQTGSIASILFCHGTLELQAIIIAGAGGLVLFRAWFAPGPFTRRAALAHEAHRAWRLLAAACVMLFFAGWIEGFVSPHASHGVRMATALISGGLCLAWFLLGGRRR